MRQFIEQRFKDCKLEVHPDKTQIIYCKDKDRRGGYEHIQFDFLGYTFRPRRTMNRFGKVYQNFSPAMSNKALKAVGQTVRRWKVQLRNDKSIQELAFIYKAKIRGWLNYYGKFYPSRLYTLADRIDMALMKWAMRKYKKLKGFSRRAKKRIRQYAEQQPNLFPHWRYSLKQLAR
jgi:RNA-directed DNA polymerase